MGIDAVPCEIQAASALGRSRTMSGRLLPQHPLSYPEIDTPRIAPKVRRASTNLPVARNFARSKSLEISGADWKHWVMQNGHSDFNRRRFVQLAAASTLAVGADTSGSAAASPSETEALVTPQPAPRFTPDENTSDIIVETPDRLPRMPSASSATASTRSSKPSGSVRTGFAMSRFAMRRPQPSWLRDGQNTLEDSAFA